MKYRLHKSSEMARVPLTECTKYCSRVIRLANIFAAYGFFLKQNTEIVQQKNVVRLCVTVNLNSLSTHTKNQSNRRIFFHFDLNLENFLSPFNRTLNCWLALVNWLDPTPEI